MTEADVTDELTEEAEAVEVVPDWPYGCPETDALGDRVIYPSRENWLSTAEALLADGWTMCLDVIGVDYLTFSARRNLPAGISPERFEVAALFINHASGERLRARVQVPASDTTLDSLTEIYPGTDFSEREVFDMFGITFNGHPDLSRILMPEHWEGHPLRKDYDIGAIPVQFKGPQGG